MSVKAPPRSKDFKTEKAYLQAVREANLKFSDPEQFTKHEWPPFAAKIKEDIYREFYEPWGREVDGYILQELAQLVETDLELSNKVEKLREKAHGSHLHAVAVGWVKLPSEEEPKPMPEEVKVQLKELAKARREEKKESIERRKQVAKAAGNIKLPVHADREKQNQLKAKYPWAVKFLPDHENVAKTNVEIKCIICSKPRIIHLADLFQVKKHAECKPKPK